MTDRAACVKSAVDDSALNAGLKFDDMAGPIVSVAPAATVSPNGR